MTEFIILILLVANIAFALTLHKLTQRKTLQKDNKIESKKVFKTEYINNNLLAELNSEFLTNLKANNWIYYTIDKEQVIENKLDSFIIKVDKGVLVTIESVVTVQFFLNNQEFKTKYETSLSKLKEFCKRFDVLDLYYPVLNVMTEVYHIYLYTVCFKTIVFPKQIYFDLSEAKQELANMLLQKQELKNKEFEEKQDLLYKEQMKANQEIIDKINVL